MDSIKARKDILRLLRQNARMRVSEIAERLLLPAAEVECLQTAMEEDGTIMGYHTVVREEELDDAKVQAIIEVEVQPERDSGFDRVALLISKFPEVRTVYLVSGRYDLRLEVAGESLQDVAFFVASKLACIEGVKATATHFLLKKYKEAGFLLEEDEEYERLKIVP
jgi:DNA-binding Lrp family transcriptional regulator